MKQDTRGFYHTSTMSPLRDSGSTSRSSSSSSSYSPKRESPARRSRPVKAKDDAAKADGGSVTLGEAFHTPTKEKLQEATRRARTTLEASLDNKAKKRRVSVAESVPVPVVQSSPKAASPQPLQLFNSPVPETTGSRAVVGE